MKYELLHISSDSDIIRNVRCALARGHKEGSERTRRHNDERREEAWLSG